MTLQERHKKANKLLTEFTRIHLSRDAVRKAMSKRENDSYSTMARQISEYLKKEREHEKMG